MASPERKSASRLAGQRGEGGVDRPCGWPPALDRHRLGQDVAAAQGRRVGQRAVKRHRHRRAPRRPAAPSCRARRSVCIQRAAQVPPRSPGHAGQACSTGVLDKRRHGRAVVHLAQHAGPGHVQRSVMLPSPAAAAAGSCWHPHWPARGRRTGSGLPVPTFSITEARRQRRGQADIIAGHGIQRQERGQSQPAWCRRTPCPGPAGGVSVTGRGVMSATSDPPADGEACSGPSPPEAPSDHESRGQGHRLAVPTFFCWRRSPCRDAPRFPSRSARTARPPRGVTAVLPL